ncbi:MAG: NfeD family protein [Planctomycetota bacterium]
MEAALVWGLSLLALSLLLIVVEVFLPSGGLIALISAGSGITGLVFLYRHDPVWGGIGTLVMLVAAPCVIAFAFRVWPDTAIGRRMIHGTSDLDEIQERETADARAKAEWESLVGAEGVAFTELHPSGTVKLGETRYDAVTDGPFIEKGSRIRVVSVEMSVVKVRRA